MDELVVEELESLEAIYPDLLKRDDAENIFAMKVPQHEKFTVKISLPDKYPATEPPHVLEVSVAQGDYDSKYLTTLFQEVMDSMFHQGSVSLFACSISSLNWMVCYMMMKRNRLWMPLK